MPSRIARRGLRVLLVEDDEGVRRSLQLLLEWNGFEVRAHARMGSAIDLDTLDDIQILISDYALEDGDGIRLLTGLSDAGWAGRAVLIIGQPTPSLARQALAAGFHAVLAKPLAPHELLAALTK